MSERAIEFGSGYGERQPVVLLLDTSESMGQPAARPRIEELNGALAAWFADIRRHERLRARVEVCLLTFDSVVRVYDPGRRRLVPVGEGADRFFAPVDEMRPPALRAQGLTRLTLAVDTALTLTRSRYRDLQRRRALVRRPFLWTLTDGAPCDDSGRRLDADALADLAGRVRAGEERGEWIFRMIGVEGADLPLLRTLAPNGTSALAGLRFDWILDQLFQSTDDSSPSKPSDDAHREVNDRIDRARRMDDLQDELR